MEKLMNFIKGHPVLTALVAVGVLLLFFWPSGSSSSGGGGTTDSTAAAAAVSSAQAANAQMQLSSDQVRAIGLQAATAEAINSSNNAAAVSIATIEAAANKDTLAAAMANNVTSTSAALAAAKIDAQATMFGALTSAVTTTQAQAIVGGQKTDAAGFGLLEMFKNLLNADKGIAATQTFITQGPGGANATVFGANGNPINSVFSGYDDGGSVIASTDLVTGIVQGSNTAWGKNNPLSQTAQQKPEGWRGPNA